MMKFFIKQNNFTGFILVVLLLAGLVSFLTIAKESDPDVTIPVVTVSTALPGASPTDVADLVTVPIEDELVGVVPNATKVTSTSREGISSIAVEFRDDVDISKALRDVTDRVDRAVGDLPADATTPIVSQVDFAEDPILEVAIPTQLAFHSLGDLADRIEQQLESIPGVARVRFTGVPGREVHVIVNDQQLESLGISLGQITGAIAAADSNLPVGTVTHASNRYSVNFDGSVTTADDLRTVVVDTVDGAIIRLGDIATIEWGTEIAPAVARNIGPDWSDQSIILSVVKRANADVIQTKRAVDAALEEIYVQNNIDPDHVLTLFDSGQFIKDDISQLSKTALQTTLLVMLVVLLGLGLKEAIIAGLAVPMSFLLSFFVLNILGRTVNFITLFSLILVVGLLVDAVIVVVEGISRNQRSGMTYKQAALATVREFGKPVIAGTATTVAVFVPLFFMSGVTGQFISGIPATVIVVLLCALVVALLFIPALGYRISSRLPQLPKLAAKRESKLQKLGTWYQARLRWFLPHKKRRRFLYLGTFLLFVLSIGMIVGGLVPSQFLPEDNYEVLYVDGRYPSGTEREETIRQIADIESAVIAIPGVKGVVTIVGEPSAYGQGQTSGEHYANLSVILEDLRQSDAILRQLQAAVANHPPAITSAFPPSNGPSSGAPVVIKLVGNNLDDLLTAAEQVRQETAAHEGTIDISTSLDDSSLRFDLTLDRNRIADAGLTPRDVNIALRGYVYGLESIDLTSTNTATGQSESIPVIVRPDVVNRAASWRDLNRISLDQVLAKTIPTPAGDVPLQNLVDVNLSTRVPFIAREDGEQVVSVSAYLRPGFFASTVTPDIVESLGEDTLPAGVSLSIGGEVESTGDSQSELLFVFLGGIALIVLVLMAQFNSLRKTLIILSVVPLGLIGVIWGLFIFGDSFSFTASLGFIALAGIVVNNSIILVDVMNKLREDHPDWPAERIVTEGTIRRLRPILLTSATTIIGMAPLLYTSPLWRPLALAVMTGLVFGVVLTLLVVPVASMRRYRVKKPPPQANLFEENA